MISDDDPCPVCRETDGICYTAENGRFRLWCAYCGHSTERHPDLGLARQEWRGSTDTIES